MFTHKKVGGIHFCTLFGYGLSFYRKTSKPQVKRANKRMTITQREFRALIHDLTY